MEAAALQQAQLWAERRPMTPGLARGGSHIDELERANRLAWAALSALPQASESAGVALGAAFLGCVRGCVYTFSQGALPMLPELRFQTCSAPIHAGPSSLVLLHHASDLQSQ
jgi:hypothetical protein